MKICDWVALSVIIVLELWMARVLVRLGCHGIDAVDHEWCLYCEPARSARHCLHVKTPPSGISHGNTSCDFGRVINKLLNSYYDIIIIIFQNLFSDF